jgi:hypothetical protein
VKKQFYNNIKECLNVTKENKKGKKGTNWALSGFEPQAFDKNLCILLTKLSRCKYK